MWSELLVGVLAPLCNPELTHLHGKSL